jgi:hypothetical protein
MPWTGIGHQGWCSIAPGRFHRPGRCRTAIGQTAHISSGNCFVEIEPAGSDSAQVPAVPDSPGGTCPPPAGSPRHEPGHIHGLPP